jgi:ABC-type Mn2+/Zn2+ transport system ATPase subunit
MSDLVQQMRTQGAPHIPDFPTLELKDVSVSYRSIGVTFSGAMTAFAIEGISFRANEAEQIAIIGPNGAGKSTLLKVVAGTLKPDSGSVAMFGTAPDQHICIAYVPQRSLIDWSFPVTVSDVVMMGRIKKIGLFRHPGKRDHEIVNESLERVQADHLTNKHIGELSGGQQQRVFIARALALETDLLLLDEPLTGLDIPSYEALLNILDGLRPDGVTVLFATHDMSLAAERFDRVMLLNRRIIALGSPGEVLTQENLVTAYGGQISKGS